jgi:hypothetical protein
MRRKAAVFMVAAAGARRRRDETRRPPMDYRVYFYCILRLTNRPSEPILNHEGTKGAKIDPQITQMPRILDEFLSMKSA